MPTLLFLSECCLLDQKSGAAQSARAQLHTLSKAGWHCHAATLTLCDGETEAPLAEIDPRLNSDFHAGSQVELLDGLVSQQIYVARSTRHSQLRPWELRAYLAMAQQALEQIQPDIVLTYGSEVLQPLLAKAQQRGARTAFYLAIPDYIDRENFNFRAIDEFLVPSKALADLYRDKMGLECKVLRDLVKAPFNGNINLEPERITSRNERTITLINPEPAKGGLFFLNIANQAATANAKLKFRAVESRWDKQLWASKGLPEATLDMVDWHPHTRDMASVFKQTALLLVPSLWFEPSARVVAEALLAGIPVLAMDSGGIKEQLNDGGFVFPTPKAMQDHYLAAPETKDLQQWLQFIKVLMTDDVLYTRAVKLALQASSLHQPQVAEAAAVALFTNIAAKPALKNLQLDAAMSHQLAEFKELLNNEREALNQQFLLKPIDKPIDSESSTSHPLAASLTQEYAPLDKEQADPYAPLLQRSLRQPAIREALAATKAKDYEQARNILEKYLRILPEDILALSLLADVASKQKQMAEACQLMSRAVALAPGFIQGQHQLLDYLSTLGDAETALIHSIELLEREPNKPRYLALHAGFLTQANRFAEAVNVYRAFFKNHQGCAKDYMQYALALKTLGQQQAAVDAYRQAIELSPGLGHAWHALSNMKLAVFTSEDIALMQQQIVKPMAKAPLSDAQKHKQNSVLQDAEERVENNEQQYNIHFTLGKAFEDNKDYAASFTHYAQANSIRCSQAEFDISQLEDYVKQAKQFFSRAFFEARQGQGNPAKDPVFIVGLHRAGSTLTEQILASHSDIEGTRELPNLLAIARDFSVSGNAGNPQGINSGLLTALADSEWQQLGQQFIDNTRSERHTERPLFIDKMPANWLNVGLIHLMLPNARIIDIRRKPMAAGFALFKMNFGQGVDHAYSQSDIARYYVAYTDLMAHFDDVLPGRVHHVQYENLVADTDNEIRALLDYCNVNFEPQCLTFWQTERAVQTPSSEQVRQPIYQHAAEQWRNYAPWLGEMQTIFAKR